MKTKTEPQPSLPAGERLALPQGLRTVLRQVRRRHVTFTLAAGSAVVLTALAALWLVQGLADWLFGLPWVVRCIFLLADAGVIGWLAWRGIILPLSRPMDSEAMALLIERRMPQFRSELISAVQLAGGGPGCIQGSVEMVRRLIARIANKITHLDVPRRVVPKAGLIKSLKILAISGVVFSGVFAGFYPQSFTLLQRLLLAKVPLPSQTRVVQTSGDLEVVEGGDASLFAVAEGVLPKSGRLVVIFDDGRKDAVVVTEAPDRRGFYSFTLPNVRQPFRYRFEVGDGAGEDGRVSVKIVPSIIQTRFTQIYPGYTGLGETPLSTGTLALLAGGRLRIEGAANQPIKVARIALQGPGGEATAEVLGGDRRSFRAEIPVSSTDLSGVSLTVENDKGEISQPVNVRIEVRSDKPPVVSIVSPRAEKLTAQASVVIPIVYTAKDDFGLSQVEIAYEVFRPQTRDQGDPPAERGRIPLPLPESSAPQRFSWDLGRLLPPLTIGSTVRFSIEARDNNSFSGPGLASSRSRLIRIVSDEEKRLELLDAFGDTARKVESLIKTQEKINESTGTAVRTNR
ncbi:MAG: hypothetical protein BGO12_09335 [Verrucomicrobia bacterium 61-8]|nr:hypothetical protein [Verrucomicrobiota bacterium]OJV25304.1 MAG: hypothetical protein BGO12_09335 [Verrucomicrobia bacterium 61-8]